MPDFTPSSYLNRQIRLADILVRENISALALNPGPGLIYLTGLHFHLMERPIVALFPANLPIHMVLPELEIPKLEGLPFEVHAFPYGENPETWSRVFHQAITSAGLNGKVIGVEPRRLRVLELRYLEMAAPLSKWVAGENILAELRIRKDEAEINKLRRAVQVAQQALQATLSRINIGMTERELASELVIQMLLHGSTSETSLSPIVASGPHSATPHATLTDRPLQAGDMLIMDWGANVDDYFSDITRTFAIGEVDPKMTHIAEVVIEANEAARAVVKPGIPAGNVDLAARSIIEKAGYGQYFTHRTGHGLGLEGHEEPYICAGNNLILEPGMTFTIEPGIYLPGQGGVRVEDDVVVTDKGVESLTNLSREIMNVGHVK
ncbi:MAG: Xaa-Pro peptidase family protein [Chloroflexota bacterium]